MDRIKIGMGAVILILCIALGYSISRRAEILKRQEKLKEQLTEVESQLESVRTELQRVVESKDKSVIITKPDGTKIQYRDRVKTVTEEKVVYKDRIVYKNRDVVREVVKTVEIPTAAPLSRYTVGIAKDSGSSRAGNLSLGLRLGNLPLFLEGQISTDKTLAAGLRIEF